jgi:hypothetical protein
MVTFCKTFSPELHICVTFDYRTHRSNVADRCEVDEIQVAHRTAIGADYPLLTDRCTAVGAPELLIRVDESVYKPDPVPVTRGRPSICDCRYRQPDAAYPRTRAGSPQSFAQPTLNADLLALLQVGFTEPPGSPRPLVVSYTTVSPLPPAGGGLFSVALSRGSLRMGVTHHPALGSPDFPRYRYASDTAAARPTRPSSGYAVLAGNLHYFTSAALLRRICGTDQSAPRIRMQPHSSHQITSLASAASTAAASTGGMLNRQPMQRPLTNFAAAMPMALRDLP